LQPREQLWLNITSQVIMSLTGGSNSDTQCVRENCWHLHNTSRCLRKAVQTGTKYTGRHEFPPWNNFHRFLLVIGLQTRMCKMYHPPFGCYLLIPQLNGQNRNFGSGQRRFLCRWFSFTHLSHLNTLNNIVSN
jgi:hypothetical protein